MRITDTERNAVIDSVHQTDYNAKIWLFGSRIDV
jgi:hypothetical protein